MTLEHVRIGCVPIVFNNVDVPDLAPLAPYDENNHAPNESTKVSLYLAGIRSGLHLLEALGRG